MTSYHTNINKQPGNILIHKNAKVGELTNVKRAIITKVQSKQY